MTEINLINVKGENIGKVDLDEKIFGLKVNPALIHEAVIANLRSLRRGTAHTKTKGEVSGGGVKPWRQKGTGRARVGSIRSPLWRHGGTTFGPKPHSFEIAFPKKKRKSAIKQVLSDKLKEGNIKLIDTLEVKKPKTKSAVEILKNIAPGGSAVLITSSIGEDLRRAFANIDHVKLMTPSGMNVHDLLNYEKVVITREGLDGIKEVLSR